MHRPKEPWFAILNEFFAKLAIFSYRNRWQVAVVCLVVLLGCTYLANNVRTDNSFDAFFDQSDPVYQAYLEHQENFGSDEITFIMYDASEYRHGVFNQQLVESILDLTNEIDT
ncbi:MAG: hypothetical protein D9N11_10695, partial [Ketobacter sp.]